ncbi:hypothetical protein MMC24_003454 [Lignoscripta atroalba]|nr:hypothetical protein [Lignoscripta atroalba]
MPRPTINLSPHKQAIINLYRQDYTIDQICFYLLGTHNLHVTPRTITRRLTDWQQYKRVRTKDSDELRARIKALFLERRLGDKEILEVLKGEGFEIGLWGVVRIRKQEGIRRRINGERYLWG